MFPIVENSEEEELKDDNQSYGFRSPMIQTSIRRTDTPGNEGLALSHPVRRATTTKLNSEVEMPMIRRATSTD